MKSDDQETALKAFDVSRLGLLVVLAIAAASCGGERGQRAPAHEDEKSAGAAVQTSPDGAAPSASPAGGPGHAQAGAVPGSYEDWCGEHHVPESLCTRCHPALIAAFKATGDWCAEHGLPESQCLACNPDLKIVRPARTGGG
jgi:hypothetical protein